MHYTIETQREPQINVAELARLLNCLHETELAALAGVKISTLEAWRKRGKGPEYARLGCTYLYPLRAVKAHLAHNIRARITYDPKTVLL